MNIKSRLTTLEKKFTKSFSPFCECYGANLEYEVIPITIQEWKRRWRTDEDRMERLPDICPQCGKPVDKRFIETPFEEYRDKIERRIKEITELVRSRAIN